MRRLFPLSAAASLTAAKRAPRLRITAAPSPETAAPVSPQHLCLHVHGAVAQRQVRHRLLLRPRPRLLPSKAHRVLANPAGVSTPPHPPQQLWVPVRRVRNLVEVLIKPLQVVVSRPRLLDRRSGYIFSVYLTACAFRLVADGVFFFRINVGTWVSAHAALVSPSQLDFQGDSDRLPVIAAPVLDLPVPGAELRGSKRRERERRPARNGGALGCAISALFPHRFHGN